jgi:hypothetical protein
MFKFFLNASASDAPDPILYPGAFCDDHEGIDFADDCRNFRNMTTEMISTTEATIQAMTMVTVSIFCLLSVKVTYDHLPNVLRINVARRRRRDLS